MQRDRRAFLSRFAAALPSIGFLWAGQRPPDQNPRTDPRPKEDDTTLAGPPAKAVLKENEKDIKKDIEKLYQLVGELKAEVEKTDSVQVLSVVMVKKAEEIEKLAKGIRSRAIG